MGLGISVSKHALNSAAPLRSPQHFFLSCILHMHPHHTHARATASLLSHSSWFWMWSTFRCMKVQCVCGCGYIICEVLPWIGHACGCAGPATLHCLGWAPSEGGLSPAHKSCQQQIRRECLVMITTQTQTRFPFFIYFFCPGLAGTLIQYSGGNPADRVHACSLTPSLSLHEKGRAEAALLKHDSQSRPTAL